MCNHITAKVKEGYKLCEMSSEEQEPIELGKRFNLEDLEEGKYKKVKISQEEQGNQYNFTPLTLKVSEI